MYGFPPYVPAPLGFMSPGEQHLTFTSISRHVEIDSSVVTPQAPGKLPTVADENAKQLKPDDTGRTKPGDKTNPGAETSTPRSDAVAQPSHAPRATLPESADDDGQPDAPLPDSVRKPVSVPANPADESTVPENPLHGDDETSTEEKAKPKSTDDDDVAIEDAPEPKESDADDKSDADATGGDATGDDADEWPDAPLPKNDLPPLAAPIR